MLYSRPPLRVAFFFAPVCGGLAPEAEGWKSTGGKRQPLLSSVAHQHEKADCQNRAAGNRPRQSITSRASAEEADHRSRLGPRGRRAAAGQSAGRWRDLVLGLRVYGGFFNSRMPSSFGIAPFPAGPDAGDWRCRAWPGAALSWFFPSGRRYRTRSRSGQPRCVE